MTVPRATRSFDIEYREKTYKCEEFVFNNNTLYRVNFPNSPLHLTQANARTGDTYWTSIPLDEKVKHIVQDLGAIITRHLNQ